MKKVISIICIIAILCAIAFGISRCGKVEVKATIGILLLESSESYTEILDGFKDSLESRYVIDGEIVYIEKNAEGDESQLDTNIQALLDENVDAIVTLGDVASVTAVGKGLSVPVFFLGVSEPVSLGLVSDPAKPDKNATGAYAPAPVDMILTQIPKLTEVNRYGIIYDETDALAKKSAELMMSKLDESSIPYEIETVVTSEEAKNAAKNLARTCDGIFLPGDATVNDAIEEIVNAAGKVPVFACDKASVEQGAVLAVGVSIRQLGGMTGQSVYYHLNGKPISEIAVATIPGIQTYINHEKAVELGYTVNDEFMNTAMLINKVEIPSTEPPAEVVAE